MGTLLKNRQLQSASTGVQIPVGSAADRPDFPVFGMIRFNTDTGYCEFFNGSVWQNLSTGGSVNYTVDDFTGDGSTTVIGPMSSTVAAGDEDQIIVFVGSIYQIPSVNYTTDGTAYITFTSAPPDGISINVILTSS
jgi:hypothetical protein